MIVTSQADEVEENSEQCSFEYAVKAGDVIQSRFLLGELLGEGSFGQVFRVTDTKNKNEQMAMKIEYELEDEDSMLEREIKIIMELRKKTGFPQIRYYGQEGHCTFYLMTLLGPNLENTCKKCGGSFSLVSVIKIGIQMFHRIETFHNVRLLHRDIKPDNFVIGTGNQSSIIHLIDFGLSKYYLNSKGEHLKHGRKKGLIGTARYASINAHNEMEQSRRDDLESICYVLIYLFQGSLPWMNLQIEQKDLKYAKILHLKKTSKPKELFINMPKCFQTILEMVKQLEFSETPNYQEYRKLLQNELEQQSQQKSPDFDWEAQVEKKKSLTVHIMPDKMIQKNINHAHHNQHNQHQNKDPDNNNNKQNLPNQFEKFDQILHNNNRKTQHMNSSMKKANSSKYKKKQPVLINVLEPEEQINLIDQESIVYEIQNQIPSVQATKSYKLLQPPSTPVINEKYVQSLNTSRANNYDWSDEVISEGQPIWSQYSVQKEISPIKQMESQNIMTGIIAKPRNYRRSSSKQNCFSALQYPQKNLVTGSDEEVAEIE